MQKNNHRLYSGNRVSLGENRYIVGKQLGQGTFGKVYHVHDDDISNPLVLKWYEKAAKYKMERVERSLALRRSLKLSSDDLSWPIDDGVSRGHKVVVMNHFPGTHFPINFPRGDLSIMIEGIKQLANNVVDMINEGVVHRDLKPNNVLLEQTTAGELKARVIDLDLLVRANEPVEQDHLSGTPLYMPPMLRRSSDDKIIAATTHDIFALGVIGAEILGRVPRQFNVSNFLGSNLSDAELVQRRYASKLTANQAIQNNLRMLASCSSVEQYRSEIRGLVEFVIAAMQPNPDDRPSTMMEINQLLDTTHSCSHVQTNVL